MSKTPIDSDAIRQLASLLDDTGLHEIEYETEALRVRVARGASVATYAPAVTTPDLRGAPAADSAPANPAAHPGAVKAPMVGVAYRSPEPGAPDFVSVGQTVSEGQTLMLIEAMKTFNPVKAPRSGRVSAILVSNEQPVEYGEPLVVIE